MASFYATTSKYPTHSCILNVIVTLLSISSFSLFTKCDAGNSLDMFKLRKGLKYSYYNTEVDYLDLPTLDAYNLGASPPNDLHNPLLAPSPFVQAPIITSPPSYPPTPSPNGDSPISDLHAPGSSPVQNGLVPPPQYGPVQPINHPNTVASPSGGPSYHTVWCVARPTVPEPLLQRAMDYACGTGADCGSIQPNGPCFVPNSLVAHASYAFNSYWQRTKILGGNCDFGGTAMLITVDPSFNGCHFVYN